MQVIKIQVYINIKKYIYIYIVIGRSDSVILMSVFIVINTNDWNKIPNTKFYFLRWFSLMNDVYIHRYAH